MDTAHASQADDEKKPYDEEGQAADDNDSMPDPDETLMLDQGSGRAWLVKVPKFLMERWSAVDKDDVHLATLRVYNCKDKARLFLFLPPNRDPINKPSLHQNDTASASTPPSSQSQNGGSQSQHYPNYTGNGAGPVPLGSLDGSQPTQQPQQTPYNPNDPEGPSFVHPHIKDWPAFDPTNNVGTVGNEPDIYELEMVNESVDNQIVVAERPKDPTFASTSTSAPQPLSLAQAQHNARARTTILTGRIKHECTLRPTFNATYRKQMKERHVKYNTPRRQIRMIEEAGLSGGQGGINRLTASVGAGAENSFAGFVKSKAKAPKGTFERMARMPRNQLLDELFALFRQQPRWGVKVLRERTQQPEVYLKEVLAEVATLHRSGEFNGLWELKPNYRDDTTIKGENVPSSSGGDVKMEDGDGGDDDDDDDDDDEDMEEIS